MSWEDRFPLTSGFSGWPSASLGDFVSLGARSFLTHFVKFRTLSTYFVFKKCLFILPHNRDGQLFNECCKQFLGLAIA